MAVFEHAPGHRQMPWVVLSDGSFLTPSDRSNFYGDLPLLPDGSVLTTPENSVLGRLPSLPENASCVGSTDNWLVLDCIDAMERHSYFLHDPFSDKTVPLHELETVIGNVSELFEIRKVLIRSTPNDVVAVMTNNYNYPIILILPGKGIWLPKPREPPFVYIIDIVFLGDKLYGITQSEELVSITISFDDNNIPTVIDTERVIKHPTVSDGDSKTWSSIDVMHVLNNEALSGREGDNDDELAEYELMKSTGDGMIFEAVHYGEEDKVPYELPDLIITIWYFVKSREKLLMVRRQLQGPTYDVNFTRNVKVFEADIIAATWVPVTDELGGDTLFVSKYFSKSVSAYGKIEKGAIYFIDTGEVFIMRYKTISMPQRELNFRTSMWIFPPKGSGLKLENACDRATDRAT
ncbi:uncharacterized protein LOC124663058 [Lolium rigidum]|uniref:uncharacterized protein LOC124663058 n=1 Tax=Lolium rigidum TaxID=89674 RepID=UPI001F5D4EF9|nr:uncharacterized protein LOC124663058 [Lolium rigidum]